MAPIHDAAKNNDVAAVKRELESGESIDTPDANGSTAIHHAAAYLATDVLKLLVDLGDDVNRRGSYGRTPLWLLSGKDEEVGGEPARLLLEHGADESLASEAGSTPLDRAAWLEPLGWQVRGERRTTSEAGSTELAELRAALRRSSQRTVALEAELEAARQALRRDGDTIATLQVAPSYIYSHGPVTGAARL